MSRTQKKCLIASGALHALLLLILIVAPAFLIKKEDPIDQTVLTLVNTEISDQPAAQPAASAPAPAPVIDPPPKEKPAEVKPPVPTPKPPPKERTPDPKPEEPVVKRKDPVVPKPADPKPPVVEKPKPPAPQAVPVVIDKTVRTDNAAEKRAAIEREKKAAAQRAEQLEAAIASAKPSLDNLKPGMKFTPTGTGTYGVSYGSYDAHVQSVYLNNWHPPTDMAATSSTVTVEVVILRNGKVKSAKIVNRSGVSKLDADVSNLIQNKVKNVGRPFPDGATEAERTYTIDFNLDLKLNG